MMQSLSSLRLVSIFIAPILFALILLLPAPAGMRPEAWHMTAVAVWMVVWWLTAAVPIPATALLPLVLLPLVDIAPMKTIAASYATPTVFLFLGGFILAAAMQACGLHKRIALHIVLLVGTTAERIILGFMLGTAFLSMWISNTATTVMMFAVGLSVIDFIGEKVTDKTARNFGVALMLAIAYSASIGGVSTIVGTPPNAFLVAFLADQHAIDITFFDWMMLGVPLMLLMLPVAWFVITRLMFPIKVDQLSYPKHLIREDIQKLGPIGRTELWVAMVFVLTIFFWLLRKNIVNLTGLNLNDAVIAISAALLLLTVPISRNPDNPFAITWQTVQTIPWGILVLFGGGLALAKGFSITGLSEWIGYSVSSLSVPTVVLIVCILVVIVFLTEITSNTATTATFLPVLAAVALGLNLEVLVLVIPAALAASMAFMMPVATPPNAIVFSYERMQLSDMVKTGIVLNIVAILTIYALFLLIAPHVFSFSL